MGVARDPHRRCINLLMHSVISVLGALSTPRVCSLSTSPDPIQVTVVLLGVGPPGIFSVELKY